MQPQIKVQGKVSDFNTNEKVVKQKQSNWFLTINTNQQYKNDDGSIDNDTEMFEGVISDILNHINEYVNLPEGDVWDDNTIKDVDLQYVIERGTKKFCLHSHISLRFKHNTRMQLNIAKMRDRICKELGLTNVYMKNILTKTDSSSNILSYMDKFVKPKK